MTDREQQHPFAAALALGVVAFGAVLACPGLLLVFAAGRLLGLGLGRGQIWAFGVTADVAMMAAIAATSRSAWRGLAGYVVFATAVAGATAFAYSGLHAAWPAALWSAVGGGR